MFFPCPISGREQPMRAYSRLCFALVCLAGVTASVAMGQGSSDDSQARRDIAERIARNHHVRFDWQASTLHQLSDAESRMDAAKRLTEATGQPVDWHKHSLVELNQAETALQPSGVPHADAGKTRLIEDRLEAGTRTTYFILLNDTRGERFHDSFVGSITKLKEDQDFVPAKVYIQYKIWPCFGIGGSYDSFGAEAWDESGTDGTAMLSGPLLYLLGCYPNSTVFTPFCELGTAFYSAHFRNSSTWGTLGNKVMDLNNTVGSYAALGCDVKVRDRLALNIYSRYMSVDVDGVFMLNGKKRENIIFTTSHLAVGLGVKYSF